MNSNTIQVHSIDIEKYNTIEEQRNKILNDKEFQKWCKELHIGSRVEVRSESMNRGTELMNQYPQYPKWVSRMF
jgi:hypothetical protein